MKKLLVLFLCFLTAVSLSASDFIGDFSRKESYIPDHVIAATGNDLFNFGISRNDDDQLSYSFDFQLEAPLWYLRFNANGITNRGWRDGWDMTDYSKPYTPGASVIRGRYDSIETVLGMKLRPVEEDFYLHLYPEIGFALTGDYGWEWGQNVIHRMMGIHEVALPYDNADEKNVHMMLDLRANAGYKIFNFQRTSLIAEVEASTKNILGFQSENQILGRVSVSTKTHDLIGFHFGYMYATDLGEDTSYTQDLYLRYLNGLRAGFTVDTGIFFVKYTCSPLNNYGYGYLGFDLMGFFKPRNWERSDAFMRFSSARLYDRDYNIISLGIPLSDGGFSFIIKNSYLGGDAISPKQEAAEDLNKYERFKRDYSFFAAGIRYDFPDLVYGYVTPFVELTAGLQIFRIWVLYNQLDDDSLWGEVHPSQKIEMDNYYGLISLEGGLSVLPEDLVVFQDTSVQIELFGGVNMILGGDTWTISIYRFIHKLWEDITYPLKDLGTAARFIPYFGFGVKLGFDL
ncbi:MAG: hypothetical protein ILP16_06195 [Spirochaetales bacterium]|nr:hypothetical protein [Spirochaetales bacterium]